MRLLQSRELMYHQQDHMPEEARGYCNYVYDTVAS